ncbi:MAG: hypothetical protein ABW192_01285 [Sphingobium sp.]
MSGVMERVARAAGQRAETLRAQVAARIAAALPGARVVQEGDRISVSGRGLIRRWVADDALRDLRENER